MTKIKQCEECGSRPDRASDRIGVRLYCPLCNKRTQAYACLEKAIEAWNEGLTE